MRITWSKRRSKVISIDRILRRMTDCKQHLTITTLRASGIRIQSQMIYGNNCNVHLCSMIYPVLSYLNHIILVNNYKQPMNFAGQVIPQRRSLKPRRVNILYISVLTSTASKANKGFLPIHLTSSTRGQDWSLFNSGHNRKSRISQLWLPLPWASALRLLFWEGLALGSDVLIDFGCGISSKGKFKINLDCSGLNKKNLTFQCSLLSPSLILCWYWKIRIKNEHAIQFFIFCLGKLQHFLFINNTVCYNELIKIYFYLVIHFYSG